MGRTDQEHLLNLADVFRRLKEHNLRLNIKKCHFFNRYVKFYGFYVGNNEICKDPKKVEAMANYPEPTCPKEVSSFLGLISFYSRFIEGYAGKAASLYALTTVAKRNFKFTEEHRMAYNILKESIINANVLLIGDPTKKYYVCSDASGTGISGVLMQLWEGPSYLDDSKVMVKGLRPV